MPGFFISNQHIEIPLNNEFNQRCVISTILNKDYTIKRNTLNKFLGDKLFEEDDKYIVITEGLFLNKKHLCDKYNHQSWFSTVRDMIEESEYSYFSDFRGSFSGAHYNKYQKSWTIYTSQTEDKPIFYYCHDNIFFIASHMNYIVEALKLLNLSYTLDTEALYNMMTFGFMTSDCTYIQEIRKLPYGCYLEINEGSATVSRYYDFCYCSEGNEPLSDEEIITQLDALFCEAVKLEYEKDLEYGYTHVACLSGGLDSRMNVWVANTVGYRDMLNICFCQSDYLDESIAKKVSQKLGTELLVKSLNDGKFLLNFRKIIRMNAGLSYYSGICHVDSLQQYLDHENIGIIHTGDIGDAIVGTFAEPQSKEPFPGANSLTLSSKVQHTWDGKQDIEKFKMTTRGFRGVLCSMIARSHYTEVISPFLYLDFFEFCLNKIPKNKRHNHYIYKKWILAKYPEAAKIPVERYHNGYITDSNFIQKLRKAHKLGAKQTLKWIFWKLGVIKEIKSRLTGNHMNPFDQWYMENAHIRATLDSFEKDILLQCEEKKLLSGEMIDDMQTLYNNGTTIEKTLVITALGAIELFFL